MPQGRYSRGYLPHLDVPGRTQFVTWRLLDSMPGEVLDRWREELSHLSDDEQRRELRRRIEQYCDRGDGILKDPRAARIVQESLLWGHGKRYFLQAWCVMPNHVHVLLHPLEGVRLEDIMEAKGYMARQINRAVGRTGPLWHRDYFDVLIQDEDHFARVASYIEWNPVKAGLCQDPALWPWSSANEAARSRLPPTEATICG